MRQRLKLLCSLFVTFMKIGGFTLGGGYAMLPIIQREVVDNKKWVNDEQMTDYLTLAQASPGVIGINTATAVGYHIGGIWGSLAATIGMVTPSIVVIICIAMLFSDFKKWSLVQQAFKGVRSAVVALMFVAVFRLSKTSVKNKFQWTVAISAALLVLVFKVSPQYIILTSAVVGLVYSALRDRRRKNGHTD